MWARNRVCIGPCERGLLAPKFANERGGIVSQELEESFFKREERKREFEEVLEANKERLDALMDDKKALDQVLRALSQLLWGIHDPILYAMEIVDAMPERTGQQGSN